MINITQEELWAFNVLNNQVANGQAELHRSAAARASYISLLESKYDAVFNLEKCQLEPKGKKPK